MIVQIAETRFEGRRRVFSEICQVIVVGTASGQVKNGQRCHLAYGRVRRTANPDTECAIVDDPEHHTERRRSTVAGPPERLAGWPSREPGAPEKPAPGRPSRATGPRLRLPVAVVERRQSRREKPDVRREDARRGIRSIRTTNVCNRSWCGPLRVFFGVLDPRALPVIHLRDQTGGNRDRLPAEITAVITAVSTTPRASRRCSSASFLRYWLGSQGWRRETESPYGASRTPASPGRQDRLRGSHGIGWRCGSGLLRGHGRCAAQRDECHAPSKPRPTHTTRKRYHRTRSPGAQAASSRRSPRRRRSSGEVPVEATARRDRRRCWCRDRRRRRCGPRSPDRGRKPAPELKPSSCQTPSPKEWTGEPGRCPRTRRSVPIPRSSACNRCPRAASARRPSGRCSAGDA